MNNIMLLVGLVDKMCFKTLFVACMDFNLFVACMDLSLIYVLWCAMISYVYVVCDIDLIASRHDYHLATFLYAPHKLHDLYIEAHMCLYLSVL
jgi:hypothetical protein